MIKFLINFFEFVLDEAISIFIMKSIIFYCKLRTFLQKFSNCWAMMHERRELFLSPVRRPTGNNVSEQQFS